MSGNMTSLATRRLGYIMPTDLDHVQSNWEKINKTLQSGNSVTAESIVEFKSKPEMTWTDYIGVIFDHLPDLKDRLIFYYREDCEGSSVQLADLLKKHPLGVIKQEFGLDWGMTILDDKPEGNIEKFLALVARPLFYKYKSIELESFLYSVNLTTITPSNIDSLMEKYFESVRQAVAIYKQDWEKVLAEIS